MSMRRWTRRRFLETGLGLGAILLPALRRAFAAEQGGATEAEKKANVTPKNTQFAPGDVRRYGAALDGRTDDTAALQAWARVGGELHFPVAQTAIISAPVGLVSDSTITAVPGATIETTAVDQSILNVVGRSKVAIKGFHLKQRTAGTKAYVAGVLLEKSKECVIDGCEFEGMQWAGVYVSSSSRNEIRNNHFHGWQGQIQDASDICIHRTSDFNLVEGNKVMGGGNHGILCQDPYSGLVPTHNVIKNNVVGQHAGYGIAVYCPGKGGKGDSFNRVLENEVSDIQGSFYKNRSSGAGIYVIGAYCGGTEVIGNKVRNCCVQTLERSLAPGGIGVNGVQEGVTRPRLLNNDISAMTQGDGILVTSSPGGCEITGCTIDMPATNNGHGPGGTIFLGNGIRLENSSGVAINETKVVVHGPGNALMLYANGVAMHDVAVSGGSLRTEGEGPAVRTARTGAMTIANVRASNVSVTAAGSAPALVLASVEGGELNGVSATAAHEVAVHVNDSRNVHIRGGKLRAGGRSVVRTTGDCTGSGVDSAVDFGAAGRAIENGGRGFRVE
jgi:parallel beta-helix repeat protein